MVKGRTWTSEEKAKIVRQGLKGRAVAELCNEYRIHQTPYYKWREQFLENVSKVFDTKQPSKKEDRLERSKRGSRRWSALFTWNLKNDW
jgi:transposase-like protein